MKFKTIGIDCDTTRLLEAARTHPRLWQADPERANYPGSPHAEAQAIIIRGPEERSAAAVFCDLEQVDYPAAQVLETELAEIVDELLVRVGDVRDIGRVMITRLPPGGKIAPHIDEGPYAEHYDRFHVCLEGDEGNTFLCAGEVLHPMRGEMFWFNHKLEHAIENHGDRERVHLIVDLVAPGFRPLRGVYYQGEIGSLVEEAMPLLAAHYAEVAHYQDIPLEPDLEAYQRLEDSDQLRCFTARDCGKLVGYVLFFVRANHHYKSSLQAWQDVLFVHPEHRVSMIGIRLIRFAEARLKTEGVQVIYHHAKMTNTVGALLERLGYELVDQVYAKRLDGREGG